VWPQYPAYYAYLDEAYGLSAAVPNLAEFVVIIIHALGGMVADCSNITQELALLMAVASIAFVSCKTSAQPQRESVTQWQQSGRDILLHAGCRS